MSYLRRLPSGKWRSEVRSPAGRKYGKTFPTKADARAWAADEETRNRKGRHVDPRAARQTVAVYAGAWWDRRITERTTEASDRSRWATHVAGEWDTWPVEALTTSAVQAWVKRMARSGMSPWTARASYNLFAAMCESARLDGLLPDNPCRGVGLPAKPPGREVYLTQPDVDAVADAMGRREGAVDFDRAVLLTAAYTGLRWGELAGLSLPRVDMLRRRIEVVEVVTEVNGVFERKPYPKSRRRRTVPIPDRLLPVLAEHLRRCPPEEDDLGPLLFRPSALAYRWGRGRALSRHRWPKLAFRPAVKAALGRDDVTVHDLRHSYASWLVQRGVSLQEVQALLGHESADTTQRYAHLSDDRFDRVHDALSAPRVGRSALDA